MEFTTAEQQQLQQLYQFQRQGYEYDPSQYDLQSAASSSFYAYAANQQQQYQYYPPQDSYSQQYPQFYQEAAPIHPPGVLLDHPANHNQPAGYYQLQHAVETQQHQVIPVSGSYSTAATANFVGHIDVVQRDNPPPQMQTAYRGGRRGGRPFRGGSRGHVGNRGTAPPHNRGRHSGSRHFASNGVTSAIPNPVLDPSGAPAVMPPSTSVPGQTTLPAQVPAAPLWPPPHMAWCELCRVDCNRPEILEQHKNGKRHKKNLQAREELQKLNKVVSGQQSVQAPNAGSEVVQFNKVEGSEKKQLQQEAFSPSATTNDNKKKNDPAETNRKLKGPSEAQGCGFKRKMRGGRGGKYMKSNEGHRRPVEPSKPKGGIPFFCELCNVKCESQVVYNSHLAGKKHAANLKRFQGHQASYGEAGLQALYPPNLNAPPPSFIPQIQQDLTDPQVVLAQLLTYVLTQAQVPGLFLPAATSAPAQTPLSSLENRYRLQFTQGSLVTSEMSSKVSLKAETLQHSIAAKSEALPFAGQNKAENQTSEPEKNEVSQQQSFTAKLEVPPTAGTDVKVENGALGLGSNNNLEEPEEDPQEIEDDEEEAETLQHSSAAKSEASPFAGQNKAENQTSEPEKNEVSQQQSFTAKFEVPPTAGTDVKVENGALGLGSNNNLEEPEEDPQEIEDDEEQAETLHHSSAAKSEASQFGGQNKTENQTSEPEKNEVSQQQSFIAKLEVPPTAGTDVTVENGALGLGSNNNLEEPEEDPQEIEDDEEQAETLQYSSAAKSEASQFVGQNKTENPTSEPEKNEVSQQQSFIAKLEVPPTAGTDVTVENGAFGLGSNNNLEEPEEDPQEIEDDEEQAETLQHSIAAKSEASPFAGQNKAENRTSEPEKNEVRQQQSFTAKFEVPPTAGTDVKVENGALCLGSNNNLEEPEEDPQEIDDDQEQNE